MKKFLMGLLGSAILIVMLGCSPTATEEPLSAIDEAPQVAVDALEEVTVEPTIVPTAVPVVEEAAEEVETADEVEEIAEVVEAEVESDGATSGLAAEVESEEAGDGVIQSASDAVSSGLALEDQALMIDFNPFITTTFNLDAPLPAEALSLPVLTTAPTRSSYNDAMTLAQNLGFAPPLFQEAVSVEEQSNLQLSTEGYWIGLPFHAFDDGGILTIYGNSAYYESSQAAEVERSASGSDQLIPQAEALLVNWGQIDFEYTLEATAPGTVELRRVINGVQSDHTEVYMTFNDNGDLSYYSYNLVPSNAEPVDYNLLTAAEAWEKITQGVIENGVQYQFEGDGQFFDDTAALELESGDYPYWSKDVEAGQDVRLYGYPRFYFPFQDDSTPIAYINGYRIVGDEIALMEMSMNGPSFVQIEGNVSEDGAQLRIANWQPLSDSDQIFVEGEVVQEGENLILYSIQGDRYVIASPPEGAAEVGTAYLNGFLSEETVDGLPVVDWQILESTEGFAGEIISPIAEPFSTMPAQFLPVGSVNIQSIDVVYSLVYNYPQGDLGGDVNTTPGTIFQPVWVFEGVTDTEQTVTFFVPAADSIEVTE